MPLTRLGVQGEKTSNKTSTIIEVLFDFVIVLKRFGTKARNVIQFTYDKSKNNTTKRVKGVRI